MSLFKSKVGLVLISVLAFGLFFTLSKLRHRESKDKSKPVQLASALAPRVGTSSDLAMLKRAQESAEEKGEVAKEEKDNPSSAGESYDTAGNPYRRRRTPDPIAAQNTIQGGGQNQNIRGTSEPVEQIILPSLRIHGRAAEPRAEKESSLDDRASAAPRSRDRVDQNPENKRPVRFVPYGRLIKAELVITLESTTEEMPLVGLITEPVYNNGHLVIPAGTEVHSTAKPDRIRNRILSGNTWKLIFPREPNGVNGRQITFNGVALDREDRDGNGLTWGIEDGSYGLRGRQINPDQSDKEIKLFAAEALRAASSSMMDTHQTVLGNSLDVSPKNAAMAGGQAVLESYAKDISDEIKRNGVYIQVPAGKTFYVYPRQVIDPDRADIPKDIAKVE